MPWPGSQRPPGAPPGRRGKHGRRRNGPSSIDRLMLATARKLEVAPKAKRTTTAIPRCLPHCHEELGFLSPWDLALYLDELSRRTPRKGNVRLPPEKAPEGVRVAIGVRCKSCKGRGCHRCEMFGWGVVYRVPIRKRECAQHEAAPETPAA